VTSRALQLSEVAVDQQASMRPTIERANEQLDPRQQLANTPPPQSTTPGTPVIPRKHSPDDATKAEIQLQLTTHLSTPKG